MGEARLSTNLDDEDAIPYFLWDEEITVRELRERFAGAPREEQNRLLGKMLREARDEDVWRFTTPAEVAARFDEISCFLGRRLGFWTFLLDAWRRHGLIG